MIILRYSISINAPAKKIFDFFMGFQENFYAWHPDHTDCRYLTDGPLGEGSVIYIEEKLHGKPHKLKMKITKLERYSRMEYTTIMGTKGVFSIEPKNDRSSIFTAELNFGTKIPVISILVDLFMKTFLSQPLEGIKKHMVEEGVNLKKMVERAGN